MRRTIASVIILIVLIVGTYLNQQYTKNTVESLIHILDMAEDAYRTDANSPAVSKSLKDFSKKFEENINFLSLTIRENHLDEVNFSLKRAQAYLESDGSSDFLAELNYLRENVQSIYGCDELILRNIF